MFSVDKPNDHSVKYYNYLLSKLELLWLLRGVGRGRSGIGELMVRQRETRVNERCHTVGVVNVEHLHV